jgi:hypothetical protein
MFLRIFYGLLSCLDFMLYLYTHRHIQNVYVLTSNLGASLFLIPSTIHWGGLSTIIIYLGSINTSIKCS